MGPRRVPAERVERLVALSVGHPNTYHSLPVEEREKWWYQLLFQFEGVAEELLVQDDWKLMREFSRGAGDQERWFADLSRPARSPRRSTGIGRTARPRTRSGGRKPFPQVAAPTLGVWSSGDNYLSERAMLETAAHVTGPWRYERIEGASHWLQLDAPERLNDPLLDFPRLSISSAPSRGCKTCPPSP